jgi:YebC/PmpR family DNA-binding regulatory protein
MSGHSKWSTIKRQKGATDAKRSQLFTKLGREISVAARQGGPDPEANARLRIAVQNARDNNMPKDTIERAIARGAGGQDGSDVEELTYEGYGNGGVAVLVEVMTDNRNRTVAEVRHAFSRYGGNLGTDGSVAYLFNKQGVINFAPGADEEKIMEVVLEAGAEDIETEEDGSILVTTPWESLSDVVDALRAASMEPDNAEVSMVPTTYVSCDDDAAANVLKLLDALDELDDVQNVYSNADLPESVLEA